MAILVKKDGTLRQGGIHYDAITRGGRFPEDFEGKTIHSFDWPMPMLLDHRITYKLEFGYFTFYHGTGNSERLVGIEEAKESVKKSAKEAEEKCLDLIIERVGNSEIWLHNHGQNWRKIQDEKQS